MFLTTSRNGGNRQSTLFFNDVHRKAYLKLIQVGCQQSDTICLAWCLMDNHIHLILEPKTLDGLRAVLARAHTRYSQMINRERGWSGHIFQGRFSSYPMDAAHLMAAVRYVENNPVKAGLVTHAGDYEWSSARAHLLAIPDGLTDLERMAPHVANWQAYLSDGVGATDQDMVIEISMRTGKPLGTVAP
jgi:putative transposase